MSRTSPSGTSWMYFQKYSGASDWPGRVSTRLPRSTLFLADRPHLEERARRGVGLRLEFHRYAILAARDCTRNAVLLVERLGGMVLERFSRDLLIVHQHVEDPPPAFAAAVRGDDGDRRVAGDLQVVAEPAAA